MSHESGVTNAREAGFLALLFGCSAALAYHYGHIGFMPLDESIVFDGGYRVLSGQLPHRDFHTPNGVVPILIQALFFKALGVTWSAYCAHAAIWNGLFALAVYALLRTLDAPRPLAGFYATLSAVVFYPPFGVPYMEQHAFFFSLLALLCAVRAVTHGGRAALPLWGWVGPLVLLGGLSKQLPTLYVVPLLVWIWAGYERRKAPAAAALVSGGLVALALVAAAAWLAEVPLAAVLADWAVAPGPATSRRLFSRFLPAIASWNIGRFPSVWSYAACLVVPIGSAVAIAAAMTRKKRGGVDGAALPAGLALGLFAMSFLFAWFTENAPENALAYLFASLGALQLATIRLIRDPRQRSPAAKRTSLLRLVYVVFVALALTDAIRFDLRVNRTRVVHDMRVAGAEPPAGELPAPLSGLAWFTPEHNRSTPKEIAQLVRFLAQEDRPFFLIGDTTILYGITGQPSLNPALWFHPGLTLPAPATPAFSRYEEQLIARLEAERVGLLVVEGERTWMGIRAAHFPVLGELARERAAGHLRFGPYRVLLLEPPLGVRAAKELPSEEPIRSNLE